MKRSGRSGSQDVQNAIVYVLNSCYERGQLDAAAWRVRRLATVRCWELGGLFLERHGAASWAEVEAALGPLFAHKPYRSCSELLQGLMKDANVGAMPELWQPTSTNWLKAEMTALECAARLKQSGEAPPVVWLPQALSTQPLAPGLLLRDKYKLLGLISDPSRAGGSDGQIGSGLYSLGFEQFEFEMIRCSEVQPKSVFSTQQNLGHHALKKREVSARAG